MTMLHQFSITISSNNSSTNSSILLLFSCYFCVNLFVIHVLNQPITKVQKSAMIFILKLIKI
jgi:hypothetical protein